MADPNVFQFIGGTVENASEQFLAPAILSLTTGLNGLAVAGVTLYFWGIKPYPVRSTRRFHCL